MATLGEIEKLTRDYADARSNLATTIGDLEDKINALRRQYLPGIKVQVGIAKERKDLVKGAIEESTALFVKPRTFIICGIRVGMEKAKGKIEWEDDQAVVKLIRRHFPEQAEILIKTTEKPLKKGLGQLSVHDLKKLGITVEETGDIAVIRPTDSDVEKLVEALLKDEEEQGA